MAETRAVFDVTAKNFQADVVERSRHGMRRDDVVDGCGSTDCIRNSAAQTFLTQVVITRKHDEP
jgi:hypothetical protein